MNVNKQLRLCVFFNGLLLFMTIVIILAFKSSQDKYWNYGPSDELVIISVKIDTWRKYSILLCFIAISKIAQCIIGEVAHPIIGFNIYNPDKKEITDFGKFELQFYGNTMYLIDAIRAVLMTVISITQIDIAFFGIIVSEVTSLFTIRWILNKKKFTKDCEEYEEIELNEC